MPKRNIKSATPNWASGKYEAVPSSTVTEFEKRLRVLRLTHKNCARSDKLR